MHCQESLRCLVWATHSCEKISGIKFLGVAQWAARLTWAQEAGSSNLPTQTKPPIGILVQIKHNMMDLAFAAVPPLAGIGRRKSAIG